MADNIVLKGGTYHVRLDLPEDVQTAFGNRKILSKSLKTGSRAEAMRLRLAVLATWKDQIQQVRERKAGEADRWREQLADFSKGVSSSMDTFFLHAAKGKKIPGDPTSIDKEEMQKGLMTIAEHADPAAFMAFLDVLISMKDDTISNVDYLKRLQDVYPKLMASVAGNLHELSKSETADAESILIDPESYKPKSPITASRIAAFRTFREKSGLPAKTIDQQQSKLEKLSAYLTAEGKPLEFDSVSEWLESLPLSSKTKAQYLLAGSTFWKWATRYDGQWKKDFKDKANPFAEHDLPKARGKAKAESTRRAFTPAEIARIHKRAKEDDLPTLTALIELGAYTGCRIEELCRLKPEHVIEVDGVRVFNIEDSKTYAGIREVPIHPNLFPLVDQLVVNPSDGYLLPSSGGNKYGVRSDSLSKAFGRLKTAMGFGPQHVFHSVRSMVVTQLQRVDVPGVLIAELVGHETGTVTFDVYAGGHSVAQKQAAIGKLDYKFN